MKITFIRFLSKQDKMNAITAGADPVQLSIDEGKHRIADQIFSNSLYDFHLEDSDIPPGDGTNITIETHILHPDSYRQIYRNLKALSKFYAHSKEKKEMLDTCISILTGKPAEHEDPEKPASIHPDTSDAPMENSE